MKKGYQLIEPEFLFKINRELSIVDLGIISFLVDNLRKENTITLLPISIDVVIANYTGNYPVIGVHYEDETVDNVEPIITELIRNYMSKYSLENFYEYLVLNQVKLQMEIEKLNFE